MASLSESDQGSAPTTTQRLTEDRYRDLATASGPSSGNSAASSPATSPANSASRSREEHLTWVLEQVRQSLTGIRFGQVVITVQDGLPIQIERTEKTRLR